MHNNWVALGKEDASRFGEASLFCDGRGGPGLPCIRKALEKSLTAPMPIGGFAEERQTKHVKATLQWCLRALFGV